MDCCYIFGNKHIFLVHVLLQRVYDEEVEETITKVDALEKQSEQVCRIHSTTSTGVKSSHQWCISVQFLFQGFPQLLHVCVCMSLVTGNFVFPKGEDSRAKRG